MQHNPSIKIDTQCFYIKNEKILLLRYLNKNTIIRTAFVVVVVVLCYLYLLCSLPEVKLLSPKVLCVSVSGLKINYCWQRVIKPTNEMLF